MKIIETRPREIDFVLWGHCQNLLDDPRRSKICAFRFHRVMEFHGSPWIVNSDQFNLLIISQGYPDNYVSISFLLVGQILIGILQ